jgi:hypothetical protein
MLTSRARMMAPLLLGLHLGGCMTWQPSPIAPRRLIEEERPSRVRVIRPNTPPLVIRNPRIENDSIAVVSGQCRRLPGRNVRYTCPTRSLVALDELFLLEVPRPSGARTLLVIAPILLLVTLAFVYYSSCSETSIPGC